MGAKLWRAGIAEQPNDPMGSMLRQLSPKDYRKFSKPAKI
jgi:hypothetical protein